MPTRAQMIIDPALSNISTRYSNDDFIAEKIAPIVTVKVKKGRYYIYDKSNFRVSDSLRAAGSPSNEVGYGLSRDGFSTADHALKMLVEDDIREQHDDALEPESDATQNLTDRLMVGKEKALADYMSLTANITQNITLAGNDQWSAYATSDPFGDVKLARSTVKGATGKTPNTMVLGQETFDTLSEHPNVIERIKYSQMGVVTEEILARAFHVQQVLVGSAVSNSATEGAADSLGYIWGKHAWLIYVSPTPGLRQVTFAWTFSYKTRKVKKWRDEDREGTYVRVNHEYVQKIVAAECAYLVRNAVG